MSRKVIGAAVVIVSLAGMAILTRPWAARPGPGRAGPADSGQDEVAPPLTIAPAADDGTAVLPYTPPEFPSTAEWVQGGPVRLGNLHGRVAVVHFWTNGYVNCIHNYPVYRSWQEQYAGKGVTILGVHTPEFDWEAPAERVRTKVRDNRLTFPVVLDTGGTI